MSPGRGFEGRETGFPSLVIKQYLYKIQPGKPREKEKEMRKVYLQHNQKKMMYNTNKACLGKLMFGGQVSMIRVSLVQMIFPKSKTPMTNDVPVINFLELPWASEHVL